MRNQLVSLFKTSDNWYHFLTTGHRIVEVRRTKSMTPLLAFKKAQRKLSC